MRQRLLLGSLCAALLALGAGAGPAPAAEAVNHLSLFELRTFKGPSGSESFQDPCGLAVDSQGSIYVSDYYRDAVAIFQTSSGVPTGSPPQPKLLLEEEPLDGPCGLALSAGGDLYVNNYHRNVLRYATGDLEAGTGTPIDAGNAPSTSPALRPTGVDLEPSTGRVYVDDRTYVAVYEPSGEPAKNELGEPLQIGLGTLGDGYGVAVSDYPATAGYIYVPDATTETIKVYDPTVNVTSPIEEIRGEGTPEGGFGYLVDAAVVVDSIDGHVFVAHSEGPLYEYPKGLLDEFNAAGDYRGRILATELIDGVPSGIAIAPPGTEASGSLYVTSGNAKGGKLFGLGPTGPAHTLAVTKSGSGAGVVTSEPAGIRCGGACAAEFNAGAQVTLTATPAAGSAFKGWSGGVCSGTGTCQISMTEDREVGVAFEPAPAAASVVPTPGSGTAATAAGPATSLAAPAQGSSSAPSLASPTGSAATRHHPKHRHRRSRDARGRSSRRRHR